MLNGTDISAYQPKTVPAGAFVIIKATQGTSYVNSKLAAQLADARRKKMLVGFYHFPKFGNDPLDDARHFCSVVVPLLQPGDNVILDHETDPPPSAAHASAWGLKFLPHTESQCARRPWVYSNVDWASHGYCAGMGAYPYWCADPSSPAGHPRVRGPFKTWVAHQYSEAGGIDHDVFNGSAADWRALGQPHQEDDMAVLASLGADGKQKIAAKTDAPVLFTTQYSDKANLFHEGKDGKGYTIFPNGAYWAICDAIFQLGGLAPGAPVDVTWSRMKKDTVGNFTVVADDAWRLTYTANAAGVIRDEIGGQFGVDATSPVRLYVHNGGDTEITVQSCMAKVSLLKY